MTPPIFRAADLEAISQARRATEPPQIIIPGLFHEQPGDHILKAGVALPDAAILAGDHLIVRPVETADDGRVVIGFRASTGEYTLTRAPVGGDVAVKGLVIGVLRSLL
jgi:SOS-response transcriptional repressor LexA